MLEGLGSFTLVCFVIIAVCLGLLALVVLGFIALAVLAGVGEAVAERKKAARLDKQHKAATLGPLAVLLLAVCLVAGCGEKCCDTKCCPTGECTRSCCDTAADITAGSTCVKCHDNLKARPVVVKCKCKDGCVCCPKCGEKCKPCPANCSPNCPCHEDKPK